ncbi:MAG TPA: hypothetical protein VG325_17740 [Solirubrobacteraceae bacterium]|nr:hypothetical protein [Solirubrobacteraceae bacterium]
MVLIDPPFGYIHDLQRGLSSPCHLAERAAAVELLDSPGILAEQLTQHVTGILVPAGARRYDVSPFPTRTGPRTWRTVPNRGCAVSTTMPRADVWASVDESSIPE